MTCCLRDTPEQVEADPEAYDCDDCELRKRQAELDPDDELALEIYGRLAGVRELGLAQLVFDAYELDLTTDDALALIDRLGAIERANREAAAEAARMERQREEQERNRSRRLGR